MELRGAIGRADDERHPRLVRLDDRCVHLDRRRSARGHEHRRPAGGQADPHGEEGG